MADDKAQGKEIERKALLARYYREADCPTLGTELSTIRRLVKGRFPAVPLDIEHRVAAAGTPFFRDVELVWRGTQIMSVKYPNLRDKLAELSNDKVE